MHFNKFFAAYLPLVGALAAPRPQSDSTATSTATSSSSAPLTTPSTAFTMISARSASPVHLLPLNAAGFRFFLGGDTAAYCPTSVSDEGGCPSGNATAVLGTCSMDVTVPGGQQIFVTPSGEIGYTQAHSISRPAGANLCPFTYSKQEGSDLATIGLEPSIAFGATSFMACPTESGYYQVFASLQNATVPQGDVSQCLGFDVLASDYTNGFAAWQYI